MALKPNIYTHRNTEPHCGAVGPIVYIHGEAWSVNVIKGEVADWRFSLKELGRDWCKECERHITAAKAWANDTEALITADRERIKGMPISVQLNPAQIAALAAAAEFIIDNGGFPDNEELTEHLRNALKVLDE